MQYTNIYLRIATLGLIISPIVSFPQRDAISFGGATDNVKVEKGISFIFYYTDLQNYYNERITHKKTRI